MPQAQVIRYNVKTRELTTETTELTLSTQPPEKKGIDIEKLKRILLEKGIINSYEEIE